MSATHSVPAEARWDSPSPTGETVVLVTVASFYARLVFHFGSRETVLYETVQYEIHFSNRRNDLLAGRFRDECHSHLQGWCEIHWLVDETGKESVVATPPNSGKSKSPNLPFRTHAR